MYKTIKLIALILLISSCQNSNSKSKTEIQQSKKDSLEAEARVKEEVDKFYINLKWDTVGVKNSGLEIKKAVFFNEEYSDYKSIKLTYKNNSGKKIKAIKFTWYGVNAFDEPAECGSLSEKGFGHGIDDDGLNNGQTTSSIWSVLSNDGDRIIRAWPTEVVYTDGSRWKSTIYMKK